MPMFPAVPLPAVGELLINGAWVQIPPDRIRDTDSDPRVSITRGTLPESVRVQPSRMSLALSNPDGLFSTRMPTSQNFGLLGRNTQIRWRLRWVSDTFGRTVANGFGSDETPMANAWTTSGGSASDFSVSSRGQILFSAAGARKQAQAGPVLYNARVTGLVKPGVVATGAPIDMGLNLRRDSAADTAYEVLVRFDLAGAMRLRVNKVVSGASSTISDTALSGGYTVNTNMWIIADIDGSRIRVRAWNSGGADPMTWQADFTDTAITAPGQMGGPIARVQAGNTNVPVTLLWDSIDVSDYRFWGEIPAWPQTWNHKANNVTVQLEAAGVLRRLSTGARPLRSPMAAAYIASNPAAYWPLEGPGAVTSTPSGLPGGAPLRLSGYGLVRFASATGPAGSAPVADLSATGSDGTVMSARVPANPAAASWRVEFSLQYKTSDAAYQVLLPGWSTTGGIKLWYLDQNPSASNGLRLNWLDSGGSFGAITSTFERNDGLWHHYRIDAAQSGGNIAVTIMVDGAVVQTGTVTAQAFGSITEMSAQAALVSATSSSTALAHVAVWQQWASSVDTYAAFLGYAGETATARMQRLCAEGGIALDIIGPPDPAALMGPQRIATRLENITDCVDVDRGVLFEPRADFGLAYRTRISLYNQSGPAISYAAGQVVPPLMMTDDDLNALNKMTATDLSGAFATVEATTGPLSSQDPPNGIGLYEGQAAFNTFNPGQLPGIAGLPVYLGTWDDARYPGVAVNLRGLYDAGQASVAAQCAALDIADYFTITSPPAHLPPDPIELLTLGYTETFRNKAWSIAYACAPGAPWTFGVVEDGLHDRADASSSTTVGGFASGINTSLQVATASGPLWITGSVSFDIRVAGVTLHVVTISGAASPQTFLVSLTPVNGVFKSIPAGSPVNLAHPMRAAM